MIGERNLVAEVIRNQKRLYEGDLAHYFRRIFGTAQNLELPYHNFRHMLHVTVMCYLACMYYARELSSRRMRNLLLAALHHDVDHSGMRGSDDLNIARAIRALDASLIPEDMPYRNDIVDIMRATEFPYRTSSESLSLESRIMRDADMMQALDTAWLQQVVFGLAAEWRVSPLQVLKEQESFLGGVVFHTAWARELHPQALIDERVAEVRELIDILESETTTAA